MVCSWLSCDPRRNLTSQNHKLLSKCPRKWNWKIPNFAISVKFQNHFLAYWNNFFLFRHFRIHQGSQMSHDQTIPNQIKPFKALFWVFLTTFLTKFNFFPIFSGFATPSHYRIGLRNSGIPVPWMETFFLLGNASRPVWTWDFDFKDQLN